MKAVILAAGQGRRIRDQHALPKGLIEIGNQGLVQRSIMILKEKGIKDILIVVGYGAEHYKNLLDRDPNITIIYNNYYDKYESLYSLYMAKDWINEEFLLLESDILYEPKAIATLLDSEAADAILVAEPTDSQDEVFVETDTENHLIKLSKNLEILNRKNILGEFVGISKLSHSAYQELILICVNNSALLQGGHYEEEGLVWLAKKNTIQCLPCWDLLWCEIDNKEHLDYADNIHKKILRKSQTIETCVLPSKRILLNPGPVTTSNTVKKALINPDICHREPEFTQIISSIRKDLLSIVNANGEYTTIPFCASGTGAIEACIGSLIAPKESALIINNGSYGERLLDIAKRHTINTYVIDSAFDEPLPLEKIEIVLKKNTRIKYLLAVHHETSSGILNPIDKLGKLSRKFQCHFIVDAMSSFGGCDIDMQRDHIDYIIASSNKCIHGMPGLSFVIAHKDKLLKTTTHAKSYYFDMVNTYSSLETTGQMPFTPPVQVIYSLRQALDELLEEGVTARMQRYRKRYLLLKNGLENLGFKCLTPESNASHLLMTIQFPDPAHLKFDHLHDLLYEKGFTIYPKKLALANSFRLACIGEISLDDIKHFLSEINIILKSHEVVTHKVNAEN